MSIFDWFDGEGIFGQEMYHLAICALDDVIGRGLPLQLQRQQEMTVFGSRVSQGLLDISQIPRRRQDRLLVLLEVIGEDAADEP